MVVNSIFKASSSLISISFFSTVHTLPKDSSVFLLSTFYDDGSNQYYIQISNKENKLSALVLDSLDVFIFDDYFCDLNKNNFNYYFIEMEYGDLDKLEDDEDENPLKFPQETKLYHYLNSKLIYLKNIHLENWSAFDSVRYMLLWDRY